MAFSSNDPRNYFALGKQADFDTESSSFKFLKYRGGTGFNVELDTESIYEGGDGQDQGLVYRSKTRADGALTGFVRPDMFTYLSAWALGSAAVVGTSAGVGTSVYVPNATVPFLTIEQSWGGGNQIDRVRSAILTSFQIEGEAGQPWLLSADFVGGGTPYYRDGSASSLSPTLESGDPAMYAGGAYLVNGATSLDIRRFTYRFERNVDDDLYTTETFRRKVVPLTRTVSVDFQIIYQDSTLYKQVVYSGGSVVPQSVATGSFHAERKLTGSQLLSVDVPNLNYTSVSVNRMEPDGETVVLDVTAQGIRAGTSIVQHRSVHSNVGASAYL